MEMALWPELRDTGWLDDLLGVERAAKQWHDVFERAWARGATADFWDYQWTFACWSQSFFTILPNRTLISNIGVGQDATHTKRESKTTNLELEAMPFPLRHPTYVVRNVEADRFFFEQVTDRAGGKRRRTMRQRARRAIGRVFRRARGILEFRPKATGS